MRHNLSNYIPHSPCSIQLHYNSQFSRTKRYRRASCFVEINVINLVLFLCQVSGKFKFRLLMFVFTRALSNKQWGRVWQLSVRKWSRAAWLCPTKKQLKRPILSQPSCKWQRWGGSRGGDLDKTKQSKDYLGWILDKVIAEMQKAADVANISVLFFPRRC